MNLIAGALFLSQRNQLSKCFFVTNSHVRKHFTVHFHLLFGEAVDELVVSHAMGTTGGIDTGDPESSEISLTLSSISERVFPCFHHRLVGCGEELGVGATEALGVF